MNDVAIRRCRRHIETVMRAEPGSTHSLTELIEEVFNWIEHSDLYYSLSRHRDLVDEAVEEYHNGDLDGRFWQDGYDAALADLKELAGDAGDDTSGHPAA